jgi:hypothetical protein
VRGTIEIGGRTVSIDTHGFADPAFARRPQASVHGTRIFASFGPDLGVLAGRGESLGVFASCLTSRSTRPVRPLDLTVSFASDDPLLPSRVVVELEDGDGAIIAQPLTSMAVMRPLAHGGHARVTFGIAEFEWGEERGTGFYEHSGPAPG